MASKTIPCRFFQTGVCRNGNSCHFSHSSNFPAPAERRNDRRDPPWRIRQVSSTIKTLGNAELCHFYQEGRCMKGPFYPAVSVHSFSPAIAPLAIPVVDLMWPSPQRNPDPLPLTPWMYTLSAPKLMWCSPEKNKALLQSVPRKQIWGTVNSKK